MDGKALVQSANEYILSRAANNSISFVNWKRLSFPQPITLSVCWEMISSFEYSNDVKSTPDLSKGSKSATWKVNFCDYINI